MGYKKEIERKFLVKKELLPSLPNGIRMTQGYLSFQPTVRVRTENGPAANKRKAYITIKGSGLIGRDEFEYDIPFEEAQQLLKLARAALVSKTRYELPVENVPELKWELDIFEGDNAGLIVVELEMPSEDYAFQSPAWLDQDVSSNSAYKNAALAQKPYKDW